MQSVRFDFGKGRRWVFSKKSLCLIKSHITYKTIYWKFLKRNEVCPAQVFKVERREKLFFFNFNF
jgi:hypothetical protein